MWLLSVEPGIPVLGLALSAPAVVILLGLAFWFGKTSGERMANLLTGFAFAIGLILAQTLLYHPRPLSWADQNFGLLSFAVSAAGAAFGVIVSISFRAVRGALKR